MMSGYAAERLMECPDCNHPNRPEAKFCQNCGGRLTGVCTTCSAKLPDGAKFCIECGQSVAESVPSESVVAKAPKLGDRSPGTYTPKHLADRILRGKGNLEGERKQVTVLFVDIKESMTLAEAVDPEVWHRILDGLFAVLSDSIHRFEGTVNQFTGDGIMALFGAPIAHEDHAQRSCYAAIHLLEQVELYSEKLRREEGFNFSIRVGINSGEVVVGSIGDDLRMDYTAQGHTVGLAARMESLAPAGRAMLTEHTAALVGDFFELRDLGEFKVKGVRDPVRSYELLGRGKARTRLDLSLQRGLTPFVGRERELALLDAAMTQAADGRSSVIAFGADAGSGKSRICYEFAEKCRARGVHVFKGHCQAHGAMIPFLPVLEVLRGFLGIEEDADPVSAREKVAGRLLLFAPELKEALPLVFDFLGIPDPKRPAPPIDPEPRQRVLYGALGKLLESYSERGPSVILIEDLHWIDEASEFFLGEVIEMIEEGHLRVVLLLNYRPEYEVPWRDCSVFTETMLKPLGARETLAILAGLLGTDSSVTALAESIRERTAGNPFFMEEVTRSLVDGGSLEGVRGNYRLVGSIEDIVLPSTVQSVVAARIDHLSQDEKFVAQAAAVLGKEFLEPVLLRVLEDDSDTVTGALSALVEAGFLVEKELSPDRVYAFRHPVTQEVAYRSQLTDARAELHGRAARVLTELYPDNTSENAALIAHHWDGAGNRLEAARIGRVAAEWAYLKDYAESMRHWRRVLELAQKLEDNEETLELGVAAAEGILNLTWRLSLGDDEAEAAYTWASERVHRAGNVPLEGRLLTAYGGLKNFRGDVDLALEIYRKATEIVEVDGNPKAILALLSRRAFANLLAGNLEESLRLAERAVEVAGPERPAFMSLSDYIFVQGFAALPLTYLGRLAEASALIEHCITAAREAGEIGTLNTMRGFGVSNAWFLDDGPRALRYALAQLDFAEKIDSPTLKVMAYDSLGVAHTLMGRWDEAVTALETALRTSREHNSALPSEGLVLANMAEAYRGAGQDELAGTVALEALEVARRNGTLLHECRANLILGRILLRTPCCGHSGEAGPALRRAMQIVERTGAKAYEPFIRVELAELARKSGDTATNDAELHRADCLFREIGSACCPLHSSDA